MKRIKRDDTEHGFEYYWADEVDALLAQQKRPQNCGTGHCSCIECVVEPAQRPIKTYSGGKAWPVAPKNGDKDELTAGLQAELACVNARLAVQDAIVGGTGVLLDGKRIDPASIYAEPKIGCVNHDCDKCKAAQPAPVKTYHDGKPWPVAPKPWVGLTDAEVMQTMSGDWTSQFYFARAIEAKLREKNGGAA
jgi:hypothetical protein